MLKTQEHLHLNKMYAALVRSLAAVTGRKLLPDPTFEGSSDYPAKWHAVGELAVSLWECEALRPEAFEEHPDWEAAANTTFQYLHEHCSRCASKLTGNDFLVICLDCRQSMSDETFAAAMDHPVAREVVAYAEDLSEQIADFDRERSERPLAGPLVQLMRKRTDA